MSVGLKILKARVKRFFTKSRFIESYSMKKKMLAGFLVLVNAFIGWNLSLNIPEVNLSIKWDSEPMTFEQKAKAAPVEKVVEEVKAPETCQEAVEVYGNQYQVKPILAKIVEAERSKTDDAKSANPGSTARGCSQFLFGTWERYGKMLWKDSFYEKSVYNPAHNVELAAWTIANFGTGDWDASKHSWGKQ